MKTVSLAAGLSVCFLFLTDFIVQARPTRPTDAQWWFQSPLPQSETQIIQIESPPQEPPLMQGEPNVAISPIPPHSTSFDPRQFPHDPCPPCGMG
ncbi:hypothetical protein [Acaryochloris sp. IP29b_bin.148]|uniref:hypothetical protein n=1 Tax=Acaryochloris sp. IP29b_bin.148 TaxID=2969218 RepID=UPI002616746B|nr:hypothetical protein [Acaryochloris sp. IP29b_bin.148]